MKGPSRTDWSQKFRTLTEASTSNSNQTESEQNIYTQANEQGGSMHRWDTSEVMLKQSSKMFSPWPFRGSVVQRETFHQVFSVPSGPVFRPSVSVRSSSLPRSTTCWSTRLQVCFILQVCVRLFEVKGDDYFLPLCYQQGFIFSGNVFLYH